MIVILHILVSLESVSVEVIINHISPLLQILQTSELCQQDPSLEELKKKYNINFKPEGSSSRANLFH